MISKRAVRVGLYARTSTSRDQDPALQIEELRQVAEQRGWTVAGEYIDRGHSGAKDRRPQLDRLMKDAAAGRLTMVCCWKFDRFARSVRHLVMALDHFRALGVDFISLRDGIDTSTPAGRFTFHVIAAVAELERELIRERTKAGIAAAKRKGTKLGRPQTYVNLPLVRVLLGQGRSIRSIAKELGVGATTIRRALKSNGSSAPKTSSAEP